MHDDSSLRKELLHTLKEEIGSQELYEQFLRALLFYVLDEKIGDKNFVCYRDTTVTMPPQSIYVTKPDANGRVAIDYCNSSGVHRRIMFKI